MKVLHVLGELRASGAEVMLRAAIPRFQELGVIVEVLSTGSAIGPYASAYRELGIAVHHIPFRKSPLFFWEYWRLLKSRRFDAVHLNTERASFYFALMSKLAGVSRVVRTIHAVFAFRGTLRLVRKIQRACLRAAGITQLAISPSVQETEKTVFRNPTTLLLNWYDDSHFVPPTVEQRLAARLSIGVRDEFTIVSVGNCAPVKNHRAILEALANLSDKKWLYFHIGEEDALRTEAALAESFGIADRVRFLGPVRDVRPYLWAADVFLMPSLHEGFGVAALEALACSVPALLADVPGLRDLRPFVPSTDLLPPERDHWTRAIDALMQGRVTTAGAAETADRIRRAFGTLEAVLRLMRLYGFQILAPLKAPEQRLSAGSTG